MIAKGWICPPFCENEDIVMKRVVNATLF